jgi:hypothetical protein
MDRGLDSLTALDDFLSLYNAEAPDFRISDDVIRELFIPARNTP